MNIFGRRKSHHSPKDESLKDKQLRELKTVFPSIRRPNNDDTLFSVQFSVDNRYNSLRIFIPSDFPNVRPVLQVDGPVQHPWLDPFKQVNGCDKLMNWKKDSSLVEVVEECLAALSVGTINPTGVRPAGGIPHDANYSSYPATAGAEAAAKQANDRNSFTAFSSPAGNFYPTQPQSQPQSSTQFTSAAYPTQQTGAWQAQGYPPSTPGGASAMQTSALYPSPGAAVYPAVPNTVNMYSPTNGHQQTQQQQYQPPLQHQSSSMQQQSPYVHGAQAQEEMQHAERPLSLTRQVSEDKSNMNINMPPLPNSFPELEDMTVEQLERLMKDSVALQAHVAQQQGVKSMESLLDQLKGSNYDMTVRNLSLGEELDRLNIEATQTQKELKAANEEFEAELAAAKAKFQMPQVQVMHELKKKKSDMDTSTDQIGVHFADGKIPLDTFITEFLEARTKYYMLCTKIAALESMN